MPSYRVIPRTCEVCGGGFLGRASIVKLGKARYCSDPCRNVGRSRPKPTTTKLPCICERCGTTTLKAPSAIAAGRGRFCSRACKDAAQERRDDLYCETCGTPLERKRSAVRGVHNFCSVMCRASAPPAPAILSEDGLTAQLPLQGHYGTITGYALIDAADVAWAQQWRWNLSTKGYVTRGERGATVYLHRELLGLARGDGVFGDHISRDILDNRRANLRDASPSESPQNTSSRKNTSSAHRGVSWSERQGQWAAYVSANRKMVHLGFFADEDEAAKVARDARARLLPFATD